MEFPHLRGAYLSRVRASTARITCRMLGVPEGSSIVTPRISSSDVLIETPSSSSSRASFPKGSERAERGPTVVRSSYLVGATAVTATTEPMIPSRRRNPGRNG